MRGRESPTSISIDSAPLIQPINADSSALIALHAAFPDRYPALFESAAAGNASTRFDILFAYPQGRLSLLRDGTLSGRTGAVDGKFLAALDHWWQAERIRSHAGHELPFIGGWLLYLGYELAGQVEPRLHLPLPAAGPIASAIRVPAAISIKRTCRAAGRRHVPPASRLSICIDGCGKPIRRLSAASCGSKESRS